MAPWKFQKWGDLATLEYGKALCNYDVKFGTYRVYGTNGPIGWSEKYLCEYPSVIIGRKGAYRGVVFSQKPFFVIDTAFYLKPKTEFDMKWAYYQLLTQDINSMDSGSAIPSTSRADFYQLPVNVPPLPVQKKIAAILSSLDNKIELNTRMNNVLEEIARALFRRWFVAFEFPNAEGEPYKSAGGKMVESEMGSVPEGWDISSLDQIAEFLNGIACQKYPPKEGEESMPVIKIRELRNGNLNEADCVSRVVPEKYYVKNGDVLFSWSGSLMVDIWKSGEGVLNQHLFKVTSDKYQKWFYYLWIQYHLEDFQNIAADKATTMGHIQRKHLNQAKVIIPNIDTLKRMDVVMSPIIAQTIQNNIEGNILSELRDGLLPKLMSGDIEV